MALRYIGTILRPYETKGHVLVGDLVEYFTGLESGQTIHVGYSPAFARSYTVESCRSHPKGFVFALRSITTPEAASVLKQQGVFAEEDLLRSQGGGKYFVDEIIGCTVVNVETKDPLGIITDVWLMPANNVWVMKSGEKEIPLPVIDEIIQQIDIAAKRIEIVVLPGLMEIADEEEDERDDE